MSGEPPSKTLIVATQHARHDRLEEYVRARLTHWRVVRVRAREELAQERLESIRPRFLFFPHWSWAIPARIHENFECVMFHMTDLPYGRGGSPLQNLIVRGHGQTVLTAFRCTDAVDAGPIYVKRPLSLAGSAEEILRRASELMGELIVDIAERAPTPVPQTGPVVEFVRRRPLDGNIEGLADLRTIYDYIRMLDAEGYPSAFADIGPFRVEFRDAHLHGGQVDAQVIIKRREDD